ncbi:MAG: ATP-binding protein [Planctomycetota bacterium]|nr:ATP-binding protein [Planctomycetota bacterium]
MIGPNDSGKTSILEALAAFCRSVDHSLAESFLGTWEGRDLVTAGSGSFELGFEAEAEDQQGKLNYGLRIRFPQEARQAQLVEETFEGNSTIENLGLIDPAMSSVGWLTKNPSRTGSFPQIPASIVERVREAFGNLTVLRWTARNLAMPSALNPARRYRLETAGFGLPSLLDTILSENRQLFDALEARFRAIFPQVETLQLPQSQAFDAPVDPADSVLPFSKTVGKAVRFKFVGQEQTVPASQASDGLLYVLGYLALLYSPQPPRLLLIEEPENGIHPNRLREVLGILRQLIDEHPGTQVIMTTHSPYVLDEFQPEEVTLCRKLPDGTISTKRLSESDTVRKQIDVFTLGEIWTAEGDEAIAAETQKAGQP